MRLAWLIGVVLLPGVALAQTDGGAGVLTRPPALIQKVEAPFPPDMADAGQSGTVVLQLDVGIDGTVTQAVVVESAGPSFDEAALQAAQQFLFQPAEIDGKPAAVRLQFRQAFFYKPQAVELPIAAVDDAGTPTVNFTGRLLERGSRDPMLSAQLVLTADGGTFEATTDENGRFEVAGVPPGDWPVRVVSPTTEPYEVVERFSATTRTEVTYYLRRKLSGGYQTVVRDRKERREVAQVAVTREEIRLIPGTNGDAFRVVQNLPGVARTPFGLGFLIVRGGKAYDTKVYIDEIQVPILFHFGGLFSTYNSNLLDDITFQAGNFNADFGRAIGGFVQGTVRTPTKKGFHGYVDVNVVDASALVETPIGSDWSVAAGFRRSYIDAVLPGVLNLIPGATDTVGFTVAPQYLDYQVRLEYKPERSRHRFFLSLFGSNDQLVAVLPNPSVSPDGRSTIGTSILYNRLLAGYDVKLNDRFSFRTRTAVGFDRFGFNLGNDIFLRSNQVPVTSRNTLSISLPEIRTQIQTGIDVQALPYFLDIQSPSIPAATQIPDPFLSRQLKRESATVFQIEPGLFVDALVKPVESLRLIAGIRADYNTVMRQGWVDPRLALFWQVSPAFALKGGIGIYHQSPDYRQGQLSRTFGNPDLLPEGARQYMVGSEVKFTDFLGLDIQLYYKDLFQQARATTGIDANANLMMGERRPPYGSFGVGRSFGAEVLLRHQLHKNFFGWVAYSLSRAERDYRGGTAYGPSQWDQPHNLIVVASYKLPFDFIVGARLRYTSGPLITPVVGGIYDANGDYYFPLQGAPNSRRLPDFFQLDIRIDKKFIFETWQLQLYLDVQNVTNHLNVENVLQSYDYSQEAFLTGLPILPVLGVRAEW